MVAVSFDSVEIIVIDSSFFALNRIVYDVDQYEQLKRESSMSRAETRIERERRRLRRRAKRQAKATAIQQQRQRQRQQQEQQQQQQQYKAHEQQQQQHQQQRVMIVTTTGSCSYFSSTAETVSNSSPMLFDRMAFPPPPFQALIRPARSA